MSAKAKLVEELMSRVNSGDELAMDYASRMQRAKAQGFDTDTTFIHESSTGNDVAEIDSGGKFGGIFSLADDRAGYYPHAQEFHIKGAPFGDDDIQGVIDENYDFSAKTAKDIFHYDDADAEEILRRAVTFDDLPPDIDEIDYANYQKLRAAIAERGGASAVIQPDEFASSGGSVQLLSGSGVRDVRAAFDPAKKDSANLLASAAPVAVGAGLAGSALLPNNAYSQTIEAEQNPIAGELADAANAYNNWLKDRPLLQAVAPEAPEELLRKFQFGDDRTFKDYFLSTLGLI